MRRSSGSPDVGFSIESMVRALVREEVARVLSEAAPPCEMLTIADAATMAAVSQRTVRRWISSGELRASRHGRIVRISRRDLDAVLATSAATVDESPEALARRDFG